MLGVKNPENCDIVAADWSGGCSWDERARATYYRTPSLTPLSIAMWFPSSLVLLLCSALVAANTEKAIFLGPAPSTETSVIGDLEIPQLAPSEHCTNCRAIRTRLATTFAGEGAEHWVRIDGLDEGRRYEVRICWAATVCGISCLRSQLHV